MGLRATSEPWILSPLLLLSSRQLPALSPPAPPSLPSMRSVKRPATDASCYIVCAVCSSGYGAGVANSCHRCSSSVKSGTYFVAATTSLLALALGALLAVYLVSEAVHRARKRYPCTLSSSSDDPFFSHACR